jgi:cytochrome c
MKNLKTLPVLALAVLLVGGNAYADAVVGDSSEGESLFNHHCAVCHSLDNNRVGPKLGGVYGRKAGTAPDFHYSAAVQASTVVWNDKTLDQWLTGPQQFIPGQRMNFSISDPQKRADIIAYLKSQSGAK